MRPLVVVCESTHAERIGFNLRALCHPSLFNDFVFVLSIDIGTQSDFDVEKQLLIDWIRNAPRRATERALVCFTPDTGKAVRLKSLASVFHYEIKNETLKRLSRPYELNGPSTPVQALLNQCNLSLRSASAEMLGHWGHAKLDRQAIDAWIEQFGRLGPFKNVAEQILGATQLIDQAALGDMFDDLKIDQSFSICVNRDPRGNAKSGEIVANMLTKRHSDVVIHSSPADAIEIKGLTRLVVYEDGMWSGTEACGVIESLLGERNGRPKTAPLKDNSVLKDVELTFAYGIATDYSISLVQKFLQEKDLENVKILSAQTLRVSSPELLERLSAGTFDMKSMRENGPKADELKPYIYQVLGQVRNDGEALSEAQHFCFNVGLQLFDHYLEKMRREKGWDEWATEKRKKAALGMHGLGLTHAFGHSVPKATLPLLWGHGEVTFNNRKVSWKPLFDNA